MSNRSLIAAGGAVVVLVLLGVWWSMPGVGGQAPEAVENTQKALKTGSMAPLSAPAPAVPDPAHRVALASGRTRVEGLPRRRLADLEDPKEIHRQAIAEIQAKVLKPCVPRPSLREENFTRRLEIDYLLQPTGIVEIQVRGVGDDRQEVDVDGSLLDCFASNTSALQGPGVQGEVRHRFVYAYRTPEPAP